ncbi:hypothetical protein GQ44DRAFT_725861 [Phaeosphaeriaceae sp. PMI808]|nr:hypothetical protein GQ44DRAFT_725861 [Phaeosphaeriaceae sp. PMI808]
MHDPSPVGLIPAVFFCTVFTGLLGLAQVFRPWDPRSLVRKWESCSSAAQRNFLLLVLYFSAFLIAILILWGVWLGTPYPTLQLLLKLSWLNGLSIEVCTNPFRKETANRNLGSRSFEDLFNTPYRPLIPFIATITVLLQVVGFGISFYRDGISRYVIFAGERLFHASAAAVFIYLMRYEAARHKKLVSLALTYAFVAVGGFLFIAISDGDAFLLANCILGCCVIVILLVPAEVECHKAGDGAIATGPRDEESCSAGSSLSLVTGETDADNLERGPLRIPVQTTEQRYDLPPTPPPSPVLSIRFPLDAQSPPSTPPLQGVKIHPLQITAFGNEASARVIALDSQKCGGLRLFDIDWGTLWDTLSLEQRMQMKKDIGDTAYADSMPLSTVVSNPASTDTGLVRIIWIGYELKECIPSSEDRADLLEGREIGIGALKTSVAKKWGYFNCQE